MTKETRQQVYNKYNGHCAYCGGEIRRFRVRYVHELQHILRSMDLSEFADDFKIKPTLSKQ